VQVGERGVVAVAVEGVLVVPLDQDHHLPGRHTVVEDRLAELAERHYAAAVAGNLGDRSLGVGRVLVAVGDVEQIQRIYRHTATVRPSPQPHP
jgi:hypothetical protein